MAEEPVFDGTDEGDEEILKGDICPTLVVKHMFLAPHTNEDEWLRNIFQSTCTIEGKVCHFVSNVGSCENIVCTKAVQKLGVKTETHPKP